jgi:hypothetical protein
LKLFPGGYGTVMGICEDDRDVRIPLTDELKQLEDIQEINVIMLFGRRTEIR